MRTVVLLGLLAIADAINKDWYSEESVPFVAVVLIIGMVMDIAEFIKKMRS